jgi:membrane protein implicated in regulation of membrane protease activity
MTVLYLGAFICGLLLAVGIMLFGIEKRARAATQAVPKRLRVSIPLIASFAVGFGAGGYLMSRTLAPAAAFLAALAIGVLAALLMRWLVARSAAMVPEHDIDDERYVLQGHIARVVDAIAPDSTGEISFEVGRTRRSLRARSLDNVALAAGTEVVIERIEGDLAFVEPWVQVERRL